MHYAVRPELKEKSRSRRRMASGALGDQERIDSSDLPTRYLAYRSWVERCGALCLLIIALPVMAVIAAVVRYTSPGPAIYRQVRVGRNGRTFTMYKFRTMRHDAEAETGAVWAKGGDPRITSVGQMMRRTHLDEIPQLINVIMGDMSLIGPRPERPEFTQVLAVKIPGYMQRHLVRPGITGFAQLNLPPDSDLESVRRKLTLDLEYIRRSGYNLDARIALATFVRLLGIRQPTYVRWFGLRPHSRLPSPSRSADSLAVKPVQAS